MAAVRIDQPDEDGGRADDADTPDAPDANEARDADAAVGAGATDRERTVPAMLIRATGDDAAEAVWA